MRKFLKVLLWIVIAVVVIIGGYIAYIYFSKGENRDAFKMIPPDAIYIIETNNLNKGWETLSESNIWKHLITNDYFADIQEDVATTDSIMKDNKAVELLLKDRQMLISAHMITANDYDFLFVVNVQKASKIAFLTELFELFDLCLKVINLFLQSFDCIFDGFFWIFC